MNKYLILNKFGINVKKRREINRLNLKELSNKTGISVIYLRRIENGTALGIKISHAFKLAIAMKIEPHILFDNLS